MFKNQSKFFILIILVLLSCGNPTTEQLFNEYKKIDEKANAIQMAVGSKILYGHKSYEMKDQINEALNLRKYQLSICSDLKPLVLEPCSITIYGEKPYKILITQSLIDSLIEKHKKDIDLLNTTLMYL